MVSLNMMAVAEEVGAEPFELKEYHMNLERFRGEPDNMIDSDGNIIFGNAASKRVSMAMCREKPLLFYMCPYRKPTQVDEERILRPTEEALLRNSAK